MRATALKTFRGKLTEWKFHPSVLSLRQMRKSLADAYPSLVLRFSAKTREALVAELARCASVEACIAFTRRHMSAGSCQIPWEIESALEAMAEARPRVMFEIGTFDGGTSLLFSRFLPTVETMLCVDLYVKNKEMLRLLAPACQQLRFFDMPSYSPRTVDRVAKFLKGRMIDVLFIDGDHRYEGVKQDFLCYRRFLRDGGLVFFHDIVEDRGGRAWAGGVPRLWKELAPAYPHREYVQSRDQEGYGIGMLTYSSMAPLPASLQAA